MVLLCGLVVAAFCVLLYCLLTYDGLCYVVIACRLCSWRFVFVGVLLGL